MEKSKKYQFKVVTLIIYLLMIVVNILADTLPINNVTTGQISSIYPTLITPANYAFSIWLVIYLLLGLFILYQLKVKENTALNIKQFNEIRYYFCMSSLGNILWIFAWHYNMIEVTVFVMAMIFYCLLSAVKLLNKLEITNTDKIFIKFPISLYFGWIMVAALININVYLVSIEWDGFGIPKYIWAIIILIFGAVISLLLMIKLNSRAIGLSVIWAYVGILVNHIAEDGYNKSYPSIIITLILCIIVLIVLELLSFRRNRK